MPKDMLKQLSERLLEKAGKNAAYQGFLNAVKNAEDQISQLHAQDRYGRVKKMTREDCNGLMKLLKQVGLKAEDVYRNETDAETKQLVRKITALAAGSHRALLAYDEKNTMSLPALLHEVRTLTLDTRGVALKTKVGGAISSRQTLTFLDDKGREISGVFIPRKVVNIQNSIQEKLNRLADTVSDPEGKAMVKDFMSRYISNVMHEHAHKTWEWTEKQKPAALNVLLSAICSDDENDFVYKKMEMEMKKLYAYMKQCGKTTSLEVVAYTEEEGLAGAETAAACGCDILMGTVFSDRINRFCLEHGLKYMPFVGKVWGRPSVLEGDIDEMIAEAKSYIGRGAYGIDLLGYRYTGDAVELNRRMSAEVDAPVCIAGSVNSFNRLDEIKEAGPWSFTIGSAFFDNKFSGTFAEQINKVCDYMAR